MLADVELDAAQAAYEQTQAEVKQANASLSNARVNLAHATIASPIDGVVIARSVDVGQTVAASMQAPELFQIAGDLTHMQVETRIDEADADLIKIDHRFSNLEPLFNQKNMYAIQFQAVYENRILTTVRCEATVDFQKIPEKHVVLTLTDCRANNFGNGRFKLEAMAAYAKVN